MKLYQEAEKWVNEQFWGNTHDNGSTLNLPRLIEERLVHDNKMKDPDYFNHREGVVHSTSLSKCLRGVVHEMLGAKKDGEMDARKLGVFKAGNLFEDFIIEALGEKVVHAQREYEYHYKSVVLVGRSDYTIEDNGVMRVGENKSVHSDSFWMREREGTLIAWHNQVQLMTYLWLERILTAYECNLPCARVLLTNATTPPVCTACKSIMHLAPHQKLDNPHGIFSYISKDDCTVIGAPVQYNIGFVHEIIQPALDLINEAYEKKDPNLCPVPEMVVFAPAKHQYQRNWLCTYCEYHSLCAGAGWVLEAANAVTAKNKEAKESMPTPAKKTKPIITVEP